MGKILILNGSPRAPRSHSKRYAQLFAEACRMETAYYNITRSNHLELCAQLEGCSDVLLVFPLYADGIPAPLLEFLKTLEENPPKSRPVVSILINCGFLEPQQNDIAVEMIRLFCSQNGYPYGSVLKIGSGEAILDTPFRLLVQRKIGKLARSIEARQNRTDQVTMPLPKWMFLNASTIFWSNYGKRNGISREQMATMEIEGK